MSDIFDLTDDDLPPLKEEFPFLAELNPQQKEAVKTTQGPLLVLSGAGTGKTRVLTTRVAYIIAKNLAFPWEILAVTFTNKAAREMQERLGAMIGGEAGSVWLGTFHRIGVKILSRHTLEAGLNPNFIIISTDDAERLLKNIMTDLGIDVKKHKPAIAQEIIASWKDKGYTPDTVPAALKSTFAMNKMDDIYKIYQSKLKDMNAVDFGDLLLLPLILFQQHPDILASYQKQFKYILVDEYQDTNTVQYLLLRLLAGQRKNICCVGDDDQSIYSWRGAEVENILQFSKIFPEAKIIRLEQNYRSTPQILACASALISHNNGRLGKNLYVADGRAVIGEKVGLTGYWNGLEEAEKIAELIVQEHHKGIPLNAMAILVRASFQTREFEDVFMRMGLAYKIIGGFKFYEREEIKDAVAYLRLVLNSGDDLAFGRIVNKPRRGIGPAVIEALQETAMHKHISLFDAIQETQLRPSAQKALDTFQETILNARKELEITPLQTLTKTLLTQSGYIAMWQQEKTLESEGKIENLNELFNVLADFKTLQEFLDHIALLTDEDEEEEADKVQMMTLHASKGLEFSIVFLPGWEEGLFPHQKALDEGGETALEEERRLAYVGLTRARFKAFISCASSRRVYGSWQHPLPSRFLEELPKEHLEAINVFTPSKMHAFEWGDGPLAMAPPTKVFSYPKKSSRLGRRVFHETFGQGTILRDDHGRLEVHFDNFGVKKVMARFLEEITED